MVLFNPWEDNGVHSFPKGICLNVNVTVRLECELAYYDSVVHRFNRYTTRTPTKPFLFSFRVAYYLKERIGKLKKKKKKKQEEL